MPEYSLLVPFILASGSPRRLQLLRELDIEPVVVPPDIDETPLPAETPHAHVERLALAKCRVVADAQKSSSNAADPVVVVAADTIVSIDGQILGKPTDRAHAARHLRQLSDTTHQVMTGVAVAVDGVSVGHVEVTTVRFAALTDHEIDWYLATGEADDKAGSYAMQGRGGLFVTSIDGSYDNVIGLPRRQLSFLLSSLGVNLRNGKWSGTLGT